MRWTSNLLLFTFCGGTVLHAQLRDIDVSHLSPEVVDAYNNVLPYNEALRNYPGKWTNATPKPSVSQQFTKALQIMTAAQKKDPANLELALLTGLTAHLAYNVDIDSAFPVAVSALEAAAKIAPADARPEWFLGIHICETSHAVDGMERLLRVEQSHPTLPAGFWRDAALCAQIVDMPAHAAQAYDKAKAEGSSNGTDDMLAGIVRKSLKPGAPDEKYEAEKVWSAVQHADQVRFTSYLCGLSFEADAKAEVAPRNIHDGTCAVTVTPPGYLRALDFHTPTLLILTQVASSADTLDDFVARVGNVRRTQASTMELPCPVDHCMTYEVRQPTMYTDAGGAHILVVAYSSKAPQYAGLSLESPQALPPSGEKVATFRRADLPHRFAGTMYTVIVMDASETIYARARREFEALLRSLVVDR